MIRLGLASLLVVVASCAPVPRPLTRYLPGGVAVAPDGTVWTSAVRSRAGEGDDMVVGRCQAPAPGATTLDCTWFPVR